MNECTLNGGAAAGAATAKAHTVTRRTTTLHVDAASPGGDGSSWESAFPDLQQALQAATSGTKEIRVAQGTYTPGRRPADTFRLLDGVRILGGFAGRSAAGRIISPDLRDVSAFETVLSGLLDGARSHHVVTADASAGRTAVLDGFTIQGGSAAGEPGAHGAGLLNGDARDPARPGGAPVIRHCTFVDNAAEGLGGAVYSAGGDLVLDGCVFLHNTAKQGGGAVHIGGGRPRILNCRLESNAALSGDGGGLHLAGGEARVQDCLFVHNQVFRRDGAAIASIAGAPRIELCWFLGNFGARHGGGVYCRRNAVVRDCTFEANRAAWGGGLCLFRGGGSLRLECCEVHANAAEQGGGLAVFGDPCGETLLIACSFAGNRSSRAAGSDPEDQEIYLHDAHLQVAECLFGRT